MLANIQGQVGKSVAGVIGDNGNALGEAGKTIAHGVTSGAIAEITGGKFAAGAAGGAMSEIASNWSLGAFGGNEEYQVALNKVLGGLAAVAVTGDAADFDTGADRAETVHRYNYLSHLQKATREQDFASCQGELLCIAQHGAKWDAINLLQETSYGAGLLAGVPAGMVDSVQGLVQLGLNPAQTLDALKSLIISGDLLSNVTDTVKQSYLARIEAAEAQYQKAGARGSFNAGVEYGKLLAEGASLVAGGVGAIKGGALLTEKITAKLVKEGVHEAATAGAKGSIHASLLDELAASGVKFTPENVIATTRSSSGQVVFLETGNSKAGLQHIIEEHGSQFVRMGVSEADIPGVVMRAVSEGRLVGYQGSGTGRPIYELTINGQPQRIAVTVGNNGFVVGANPRGSVK